jgi:DNA-binding MarR family transcriptional regulator
MTDTPALVTRRRPSAMPRAGSQLASIMLVLWRRAQETADPTAPWTTTAMIRNATTIGSATVSANIVQLIKRGLVERGRLSGEQAYCLTDAGAVACARAFAPLPSTEPDAAA